MVTIVKLGGSYITDKNKPESILEDRLEKIAKELSFVPGPKIVIHGGGSFGHYYALKYGIDNPIGISKTRMAMYKLSMKVCEYLDKYGLRPVIFPGGSHFIIRYIDGRRIPTPVNFYPIERTAIMGNTPVTFGDITFEVSRTASKPTIISGDEIAYAISAYTVMRYSSRVFMISDVPGVYVKPGGPLIKRIKVLSNEFVDENGNTGSLDDIEFRDVGDATGGMKAKLERAMKIARKGVKVIISNSILEASRGRGTIIEF